MIKNYQFNYFPDGIEKDNKDKPHYKRAVMESIVSVLLKQTLVCKEKEFKQTIGRIG